MGWKHRGWVLYRHTTETLDKMQIFKMSRCLDIVGIARCDDDSWDERLVGCVDENVNASMTT